LCAINASIKKRFYELFLYAVFLCTREKDWKVSTPLIPDFMKGAGKRPNKKNRLKISF